MAKAANVFPISPLLRFWRNPPGNRVEGNFIGTDVTGTLALGNQYGVNLLYGKNNVVGGTAVGAGNVISGNRFDGVHIEGREDWYNTVLGNRIGTDVTGTRAVGNENAGVWVMEGFGTLIGGTTPEARNIISGNGTGVLLYFAHGTRTQGNYIGTDITGTQAVPNGIGVGIYDPVGESVGGTEAGAGNLISGNTEAGIYGVGTGSSSLRAFVQGNIVGTDVSGTRRLGNGRGIEVDPGLPMLIGGTEPGAGNLISGNVGDGVTLQDGRHVVQGNRIGTDGSGTAPLGNGGRGVLIAGFETTVGGTEAGAANTIAFNGHAGVEVQNGPFNRIRGNAIYSNAGLGIDLQGDGPTPNDPGDADGGANGLQNFPVVSEVLRGESTHVSGTLNSRANTTFTLDFYASPTFDPPGFGEGARYLGSTVVTTDAGGNAIFDVTLAARTTTDEVVTATATDPFGNTSEFSPVTVGTMEIDIQPADPSNEVILNSTGVVAVALLTTSDFDAATADASDLSRIRFGDVNGTARVSPVRESVADVDGDGDLDRVFVFSARAVRQSGALTASSTEAELTGFTFSGMPFRGEDAVSVIVPPPEGAKIDADVGDVDNRISLAFNGDLTVALLTNPDFDAGAVDASDLSKIRFGDANGTIRVSPQRETLGDVDGDGDVDRVFVFAIQDIRRAGAMTWNTREAELTGVTFAGTPFSAKDAVMVVFPIQVLAPTIEDDPLRPGTTRLVVDGTSTDDRIVIRPRAGSATDLEVLISGFNFGPYAPTGGIRVLGYMGNDRIEVDGAVIRDVVLEGWEGIDTLIGARGNDLLDGGAGNDRLLGRLGNNVLVGGTGNDTLYAGLGRDVLIGGEGADRLFGGGSGSLLVAGRTVFDADPSALAAIRNEWASVRDYRARVANLRAENNPEFNDRYNAGYFFWMAGSVATVFDDGARDVLTGGPGMDWFVTNRVGGVADVVIGKLSTEIRSEIG